MSDYDNKRSGFAWKVENEGACIGRGSITDGAGNSVECALIRATTKNGTNLLRIMTEAGAPYDGDWKKVEAGRVWKEAGVLFVNDQKGNDRAPKFTGSYSVPGMERVSCWTGEKDGKSYMSLKFQPPFEAEGGGSSASAASRPAAGGGGFDDEIPF